MEAAITEFRDKKGMLVFLGILQILLGILCTLIVVLVIVGTVINIARDPNFQVKSAIPAALIYIIAAVWFIWMGIGSIMARRWARALTLIVSWIWLIGGIVGMIFFVMFVVPNTIETIRERSNQVNNAMIIGMKIGMIAAVSFIYVIIPAVGILGYSGKNIKLTCENRDPKICWTDKCPLPVLAICFIIAFTTVCTLFMGAYNWTIPFFGILLSGAKGAGVIFFTVILYAYAACAMYKLKIIGWWIKVLMSMAWAVSTLITLSYVKLEDYYKLMGYTEEQIRIIGEARLRGMMYSGAVAAFMILAYMFFILKYFKKEKPSEILPVVESKD
jgi:hypothetical protein